MPTQQKIDTVKEISDKFKKAKGIYFTDYLGLNVDQITELRKQFHAQGIEYQVVKNTLAKLAFQNAGMGDGIEEVFKGPTAIAFSYDDPTTPAKIIKEFRKSNDLPELKAFIFEGQFMDKDSFTKVASLPTREELMTVLLGGLMSPLRKVVATLSSPMVNLVNVLNNLKESKKA